jgi:sugar fermentation stimulation protein A
MRSCWEPGVRVELSHSQNPRRKLSWTLERVDMGHGWIGVHTGRTNPVVAEGIGWGRIAALAGYRTLRREVRFAAPALAGRLDLRLEDGPAPDALVEVKNVTLLDGDYLRFPDAVTERGRKHLELLAAACSQGLRGVILFALNRPEGAMFAPAAAVDPAYSRCLRRVVAAGVEVLAVRIEHGPRALWVAGMEAVDLEA